MWRYRRFRIEACNNKALNSGSPIRVMGTLGRKVDAIRPCQTYDVVDMASHGIICIDLLNC